MSVGSLVTPFQLATFLWSGSLLSLNCIYIYFFGGKGMNFNERLEAQSCRFQQNKKRQEITLARRNDNRDIPTRRLLRETKPPISLGIGPKKLFSTDGVDMTRKGETQVRNFLFFFPSRNSTESLQARYQRWLLCFLTQADVANWCHVLKQTQRESPRNKIWPWSQKDNTKAYCKN